MGVQEEPDAVGIGRKQYRWNRHMRRMTDDRMSKIITHWVPTEKNSKMSKGNLTEKQKTVRQCKDTNEWGGTSKHRDGHIGIFTSVTNSVQVLQCCGAKRKKKQKYVSDGKVVERDGSEFRVESLDGLEMGISETQNFKISFQCSECKNCGQGIYT